VIGWIINEVWSLNFNYSKNLWRKIFSPLFKKSVAGKRRNGFQRSLEDSSEGKLEGRSSKRIGRGVSASADGCVDVYM
jgi:hypothetical protein